jgi:hypothetical protein
MKKRIQFAIYDGTERKLVTGNSAFVVVEDGSEVELTLGCEHCAPAEALRDATRIKEGTSKHFIFDARTFVQPGDEHADGEWPEAWIKEIDELRTYYPELAHWGRFALGNAFGSFSSDVLEVHWADWMLGKRDEIFLDYCCWRQTRGPCSCISDETLSTADDWKV